jgi:RNA polymerase II-associated factor 1
MRPMESDGDHFLSYYLTKDDDVALQFKNMREQHLVDNEEVVSYLV